MYSYHYKYIVPTYGQRARLLFTGTDSLCYHIKSNDVYMDMLQRPDLFDTINYHEDHPLFSEKNKKVIGKMKGKPNGALVQEFVGLRSKMYSLKFGGSVKKTAKGISRAVVKKEITHKDYKTALFSKTQSMHTMTSFRNIIKTVDFTKTSLSPFDNNRYILADGYSTLANGR